MKAALPLLPFFLAAFFSGGCTKHETASSPRLDLPPVRVRVTPVMEQELAAIHEVTGAVRPVQRATIAAKVMGNISEFPVALGQAVSTGELLLKINAAEITARVAQARAQLNQAQRDLRRERTLLEQNASTADVVKSLEDRVAMTEAMVREAEVMLGYTTITAPFAGVIARKHVDIGDLAAPGMPLLEIEAADQFEIEAGIPDSLVSHLRAGGEFLVAVPTADATFRARLQEISSSASSDARTVTVRLSVPRGVAVRSGQFARVFVPGAPARTLLAPTSAVTTLGQLDRVFVADNGRAVLRIVKLGASRGDNVEVLSGLSAGESIVVNPPESLREGQSLEVLP